MKLKLNKTEQTDSTIAQRIIQSHKTISAIAVGHCYWTRKARISSRTEPGLKTMGRSERVKTLLKSEATRHLGLGCRSGGRPRRSEQATSTRRSIEVSVLPFWRRSFVDSTPCPPHLATSPWHHAPLHSVSHGGFNERYQCRATNFPPLFQTLSPGRTFLHTVHFLATASVRHASDWESIRHFSSDGQHCAAALWFLEIPLSRDSLVVLQLVFHGIEALVVVRWIIYEGRKFTSCFCALIDGEARKS